VVGKNMLQEFMCKSSAKKMDDEDDSKNDSSPCSNSYSTNMYSCSTMSPLPDQSRSNEQYVHMDELEK